MKTVFLITARLKSTRLPNKLLQEVCGRPIFAHMIERLKLAKLVDEIVVCTSTNPQDDGLEELAAQQGIGCFRGSEDDVVKRLADAATEHDAEYVLSITADCPFSDPDYADKIVATYEETGADLIRALDLPHGAYSYGVKPAAFRKVLEIKDETNTEVWSRYFTDLDLFTVLDLPIRNPRHLKPNLRMTLDYPDDLEFFRTVFSHLYEPGKVFSLDEVLDLLEQHPEIVSINSHCAAAYKKRWTRQSSIKLKPRYEVKTAAIIGCGSIGRRHLRNLTSLGIEKVIALRSGFGPTLAEDNSGGLIQVIDWESLFAHKPDVAIISNPTSEHLETVRRCLQHIRGVFIEKPLARSLEGVQDLLNEIKERCVTSFVGYNLQFHSIVKHVQEFLDNDAVGKPILFQCQVGQFIEDWHPGRDFREAYYARKDLGGGAALSLIHEVHMATEFFGPARSVSCLLPKSDLVPLEVDLIADMMIEHASGTTSQIHLDLVQRPANRQGVISCERGWITYDFINRFITATTNDQTERTQISTDSLKQSYIEEMQTFLDCVREGKVRHEHDAWHATQSLAVVDSAMRASQDRVVSDLPAWVRSGN